jgi:hypothetical protein
MPVHLSQPCCACWLLLQYRYCFVTQVEHVLTQQCWFCNGRDWQNDDSWFLFTSKNCFDATESWSASANHYKKSKGSYRTYMVFLEQQWLVDFRLWSWQWIKVRGQLHDPATSPMRQEPKMLDGPRIRSGPMWTTDKSLLLQDTESRIPSSSSSQPDHYIDWAILWAPQSVYLFVCFPGVTTHRGCIFTVQ